MNASDRADAINAAGLRSCPVCHRANFPTDAAWITDCLLLVNYPRVCPHIGAGYVLVNAQDLLTEAAGNVDLLLPGRRCHGLNRYRRPCHGRAIPGSSYCHWHTEDPGAGLAEFGAR